MTALATLLFWTGCMAALFAAYLGLVDLLTDVDAEDAGTATRISRGGRAEPSSGPTKQSHIAHDRGGR